MVTREELKKRLWPSDTFVDFDQSLNRAVNRLREALGDSAEHPRFIETLPRRGYRFIAPVARGGSKAILHSPQVYQWPTTHEAPPGDLEVASAPPTFAVPRLDGIENWSLDLSSLVLVLLATGGFCFADFWSRITASASTILR